MVLDASALLAYLHQEKGWQRVSGALADGARISSVNWCEVAQKARAAGLDVNLVRSLLDGVGLVIEAFSSAQADVAASLWQTTRRAGLSLADRACLALALEQGSPVLTADRAWNRLGLGAEIELIR